MNNWEMENLNNFSGDEEISDESYMLMPDEKAKNEKTVEPDEEAKENEQEAVSESSEEHQEEASADTVGSQKETVEETSESEQEAVAEGSERAGVDEHTADKVPEKAEAKEKPATDETPVEEPVMGETPAEAEAKVEPAAKDKPVEEVSDSVQKAVVEGGEESQEKAPTEEPDEETPTQTEPAEPVIDPKEAAEIAQQTEIVRATYDDMKLNLPKFQSGDKVAIGYKVIEGNRSRIQNFEGVVIAISAGHGMDKTFTVRKISSGVGVERIFPMHSPNIESIKVLKRGKVRRAKLYYLRSLRGKAARLRERT